MFSHVIQNLQTAIVRFLIGGVDSDGFIDFLQGFRHFVLELEANGSVEVYYGPIARIESLRPHRDQPQVLVHGHLIALFQEGLPGLLLEGFLHCY